MNVFKWLTRPNRKYTRMSTSKRTKSYLYLLLVYLINVLRWFHHWPRNFSHFRSIQFTSCLYMWVTFWFKFGPFHYLNIDLHSLMGSNRSFHANMLITYELPDFYRLNIQCKIMICAYRHQNVYIYKIFCFTLSYDIMFINMKFTLVA